MHHQGTPKAPPRHLQCTPRHLRHLQGTPNVPPNMYLQGTSPKVPLQGTSPMLHGTSTCKAPPKARHLPMYLSGTPPRHLSGTSKAPPKHLKAPQRTSPRHLATYWVHRRSLFRSVNGVCKHLVVSQQGGIDRHETFNL